MHKLREPTEKQKALALSLGLKIEGKSFRVLSAEITDTLEVKSFQEAEAKGLSEGVPVRYVGERLDMPAKLIISTVAKNGFIFFKRTSKHCRPWEIEVIDP